MILNYIWIALVLLAILVAVVQGLVSGNADCLSDVLNSTFSSAKNGFEISIGLTGVLSLWMGIMKIGEEGGVVSRMSKAVSPFFTRLFPDLPKGHPAFGSMLMNLSATMLGIDNAATPLGLQAMREMQETNSDKQTASNPMIMFMVLVTSGLTFVPVSIMTYRAQMGAANPADVFLPILLSTYFAAMAGLISVAIAQKIRLWDKVILGTLGGITAVVALLIWAAMHFPQDTVSRWSGAGAAILLLGVIGWFIAAGMRKKINVYDAFIDGAKGGFQTAVGIIPYLIAILVAVGMFRASGAMDYMVSGIGWCFSLIGLNTDFVPALPTALMRPLSGSGARGMMVDAMVQYGADSFVGRVVSIVQGSTDTTFYILAVYFGSVNIKNIRYAVVCSLIADFAGLLSAILLGYLFFH
ncbi:MAG: hypothetical protein IJS00_04935 [Paludibacteraceae bacterium]|nr:hypothetical protein [Paludibacteraceae bacterium]